MSEQLKPGSKVSFAAVLADLVLDGAALCGAGLITWGVDLIYHPAGFIVAGTFLLGGSWKIAQRKAG